MIAKYLNKTCYLLLLIVCLKSYGQTITGTISSSDNKPLESANVIAISSDKNAQIKFAIADNKGRYKLVLDAGFPYEVTVSYIGYKDEILLFSPNSNIKTYDFRLEPTGENLKEIKIKYNYQPIVVKKDTLLYDVKAFTNGNERKLRDQLEKLPGVEVDKNGGVTVQGKKVTKFLVEGDLFFGGGSKLGVENIPANAVDKVEVIDHFNTVNFLKNVSDSEDLAMNIKLKADKKKFVFGDIEAAAEIANDNGFHLLHAALFYYSQKSNISFIGDANNIGKRTFTFADLMRFEGGVSSFLSGRKPFSNLFSLTDDNRDVLENKSQFSALNFSLKATKKLNVSGFGLFSKLFTNAFQTEQNTYFSNQIATIEQRISKTKNRTTLGIGNIKLDYTPNSKSRWFYNGQYKLSNNNNTTNLSSITNATNTVFETIKNVDNATINQFAEWHRDLNENHKTTLVTNQSFDRQTPQNSWLTNRQFLTGLIPLQNDSNYRIEQLNKIENNTLDFLFKHYWIFNPLNHLYTHVGNNFSRSRLITSENQLLTNGTINDFNTSGFGNSIKYQLNDAYVGLEYKFKIGNLVTKPGFYWHQYDLRTIQFANENIMSKTIFQPQLNTDYQFNASETLAFTYKLAANFPDVEQLASQFTLQSFNTVFRGNALLQNERFHSANLRYSKMNMYKGITMNSNLNFNRKLNTIRNEIQLQGINQFSTPILTQNPETNVRFSNSISKKIYRFNLKFNTNLSWFTYVQKLNNVVTTNNRNIQNLGLTLKMVQKKWSNFSVTYNKGFSQFVGITTANAQTDEFLADMEIMFLKNFVFKFDYENLKNTNADNATNRFDVANASCRYKNKNNAFGFEIFINNLFNTTSKNDFTFSDFIISQRQIFILPRVAMFSVSYKL